MKQIRGPLVQKLVNGWSFFIIIIIIIIIIIDTKKNVGPIKVK